MTGYLKLMQGYSHQPSDIPLFIDKMKNGYDCVFGSRFCIGAQLSDKVFKRYLISRGGTFMANILLGTSLLDMTSGFEMFTHTALKKILKKGIRSRGPFFQTEIKVHASNFNITQVPIHYQTPSHNVGKVAINDAFVNLWYLFKTHRLKIGS